MADEAKISASSGNEWSIDGFLRHFKFVHEKMADHAFAWVLGAGASKASGIPTGGDLVQAWLEELCERHAPPNTKVEKWATAENLGIKGFDYADAASFYPRVYERRFRDNPDEGYAYLEGRMCNTDPSPGYSYLAKILEKTSHRVVITTNFDNLVADALQIYCDTFPFVCGHESLTGFIRASMRRPLVCKIHRDLLLGPRSDSRGLKRLHESWAGVLRSLLSHHTPIFIGYGGNDDSLMDLLESLEPGEIRGQPIWCYYEGSVVKPRIRELVSQHRGVLVAAPEFDVLLALLGHQIGVEPLDSVLEERARQRLNRYQERVLKLDTSKHPLLPAALAATFANLGGWWAWELKVRAEVLTARKELIYRQGMHQCPTSFELACNFAGFLQQSGKIPEATEAFDRALAIARERADTDARALTFMAAAIFHVSLDPGSDETSALLSEARQIIHKERDWLAAAGLAGGLLDAGWSDQDAEELLNKALSYAPSPSAATEAQLEALAHVYNAVAAFRWIRRSDAKEAELYFRRALAIAPEELEVIGNLGGLLLATARGTEAASYLERAWLGTRDATRQLSAEVAIYLGLARRTQDDDDSEVVERLRSLFDADFQRSAWSFEAVLSAHRELLSEGDRAFYELCAQAVLDKAKVPEVLNAIRRRTSEASFDGQESAAPN